MKKLKQYKFLLIIMAIVCCFCFGTVAYSAIYTTMNITGVAYARLVKDVRVTDFKLNNLQGGASVSYTEFSKNTLSLNVNILDASSVAVFDVEITNYGSADIGILQIVDKSSSGTFFNILNYEYGNKLCDSNGKCNNMAVSTIQIEVRGSAGEHNINLEIDFRTFHSVTYTGITNNGYPTEVMDGCYLSVNFKENLKRISVLSGGEEINYYESISSGQTINVYNISNDIEFKYNEPPAKLVRGNLNTVGSEVCIKDECFYIISNDGSTVAMLAKYNLHVGNKYDGTNGVVALTNSTGIQDSTAKGWFSNYSADNPIIGGVAFSSTNYWSSAVNSYPAYVYDSNSTLYNYVENYKTYLSTLRVSPAAARLITYEELENLGCSGDDMSCGDALSWVYSTSYWSGSACRSEAVWYVDSDSNFDPGTYSFVNTRGVRPVIELSVDDIYVESAAKVVSGDYDTVGSEICIKEECFYVISSDEDTVTMLAKYNLHVGNSANEDWSVTPLDSPTGKQDEATMQREKYPYIGTTAFSSDAQKGEYYSDYSGSIVERYVNNYNSYLNSLGVIVTESRLITLDELNMLGCQEYMNEYQASCPSWIFTSNYWTGTPRDKGSTYIWLVYNFGYIGFDDNEYVYDSGAGVRPVITIDKSNF